MTLLINNDDVRRVLTMETAMDALEDAYQQLVPPLVQATTALRLGDGLREGTDVGPVISRAACDRIRGWIERGVADGARLLVDGRETAHDAEGSFVGPTILDRVDPAMAIAREDLDEALLRQSVGSQQSRRLTDKERRIVADHEGGHALCRRLFRPPPSGL